MKALSSPEMAQSIAALIEARLQVGGADLQAKLARGGRRLPRRVRAAARLLAEAEARARHPRLRMLEDRAQLARAYAICHRHLAPLGRGARIGGYLREAGTSVALAVFVALVMVVLALAWQRLR